MKLLRIPVAPLALAALAACADPPTARVAVAVAADDGAGPALSLYGGGDLRRAHPGEPCAEGLHRQFDFWAGAWNVFGPAGGLAGTNVVRVELDGCLVSENWTAAAGVPGRSINTYDGDTGLWHQTWVGSAPAGALRLAGGIAPDGRMILGGPRTFPAGGTIHDTIRWTAVSPDTVTQEGTGAGAFVYRYFLTYVRADTPVHIAPSPLQACVVQPRPRELDFWVGDWAVEGANGLPLGESRVSKGVSNCLVEENFATPRGYRATSFAYFHGVDQAWYRTVIDSEGERVELKGALVDGMMVMTGTEKEPGVGELQVRVTLEPAGSDRVLQTWETSRDGGVTWSTDLELVYVRR